MEINWSLVGWTVVNFVALYWLLRKYAWKSIAEVIQNRETEIVSNLERAESEREKAIELKHEYETSLSNSQQRAEEMIANAQRRSEEIRQELLEKAQAEAAEVLRRAEETIAREREEAVASLREEVSDLALLVASKVLERELRDEDQERLARSFVDKVGQMR